MMHQSLDRATDALAQMIEAARADLLRGRSVDLANIENVATAIHRSVASNADIEPAQPALVSRLESILVELGSLEADLTRRNRLVLGA